MVHKHSCNYSTIYSYKKVAYTQEYVWRNGFWISEIVNKFRILENKEIFNQKPRRSDFEKWKSEYPYIIDPQILVNQKGGRGGGTFYEKIIVSWNLAIVWWNLSDMALYIIKFTLKWNVQNGKEITWELWKVW